jgi:hypothetical protein
MPNAPITQDLSRTMQETRLKHKSTAVSGEAEISLKTPDLVRIARHLVPKLAFREYRSAQSHKLTSLPLVP